jgi:hypothetical protein
MRNSVGVILQRGSYCPLAQQSECSGFPCELTDTHDLLLGLILPVRVQSKQ